MLLSRLRAALLVLLIAHCSLLTVQAQTPKTYSSADILLGLQKLNVLGSALYVAAHPDDENTRLIAYLSNGRLVETGYLSCTRGDGGQDLIGPEIREALGVIRTQELLAARRVDGGRQFFTRANDFGFSKTSAETFTLWDKEQVLADMVWVIRQRRPDVLITRFPPDPRAGHGHHQASAILAAEAFDAAGDPKRFPEQLKYVQPWQPRRLLWNTGGFFTRPGEDLSAYLKIDAGGYNPLLGESYGEMAARSRSNHRSQGFGSSAQRGEAPEYFQLVKGEPAKTDLFDGVDLTWNRVPGGAAVGKAVEKLIKEYDAANPSASVAGLLKVREELLKLGKQAKVMGGTKGYVMVPGYFWQQEKLAEVENLIQASLGLYIEATASEPTAVAGEKINLKVNVVNRAATPIKLLGIYTRNVEQDSVLEKQGLLPPTQGNHLREGASIGANANQEIKPNSEFNKVFTLPILKNEQVSQPYWLREEGTIGMYKVPAIVVTERLIGDKHLAIKEGEITKQEIIGSPENPPIASVIFTVEATGNKFLITVPVQYKHTDPVLGERYQPLAVVPPVAVNIAGKAYVFADNQPKTVPVTLLAGQANQRGSLSLQVPAGWQVEPAAVPFELLTKNAEQTVEFRVRPTGSTSSAGQLRAVATVDGRAYSRGIQTIAYSHIPTQLLFPEAVAPLVRVDLAKKGTNLGYLMGAGDDVPEALRQIGYNVTLLQPAAVTPALLARFDAVLLGVRAYNTVERLRTVQPALLDYVKNGGNLIVQYTVDRGTVLPEIGPYPLTLSRDRVTVENAPVKFLNPSAPLLNTPNKITAKDFEGWVQEQGLYYPSKWDARYQTLISSHDPDEPARDSAILVADYGKGHYIYTGLSLFRELPAGVPGAYRILANMISLGK